MYFVGEIHRNYVNILRLPPDDLLFTDNFCLKKLGLTSIPIFVFGGFILIQKIQNMYGQALACLFGSDP